MWVDTWAPKLRIPWGNPGISDISGSWSRDNWICVVHVCTLLDTYSFPEGKKKPTSWGAHEKRELSAPAVRKVPGHQLIICLLSLGAESSE